MLRKLLLPEDGTTLSHIYYLIVATGVLWATWHSNLNLISAIVITGYTLDSLINHWQPETRNPNP